MILNFLICIFIGLIVGYKWGYTDGKNRGKAIGKAHTSLNLLQKSLEEGHCVLCGEKYLKSGRNSATNIELKSNSKNRRE